MALLIPTLLSPSFKKHLLAFSLLSPSPVSLLPTLPTSEALLHPNTIRQAWTRREAWGRQARLVSESAPKRVPEGPQADYLERVQIRAAGLLTVRKEVQMGKGRETEILYDVVLELETSMWTHGFQSIWIQMCVYYIMYNFLALFIDKARTMTFC